MPIAELADRLVGEKLGWLLVRGFEAKRVQLQSSRLKAPLRLAHLSDLHAARWLHASYLRGIVAACERFEPDLICWTGDFYHHDWRNLEAALACFRQLHERVPSYAVLGNHEYDAPLSRCLPLLEASGLHLLRNAVVLTQIGKNQMALLGIDDWKVGKGHLPREAFELEEERFRLLLTHQPGYLWTIPSHSLDLALTGHLHGGQWRLPLLGTPAVPSAANRFFLQPSPFLVRGNLVYVSRGLGYTYLPLRIQCPPELVLLELSPKLDPAKVTLGAGSYL